MWQFQLLRILKTGLSVLVKQFMQNFPGKSEGLKSSEITYPYEFLLIASVALVLGMVALWLVLNEGFHTVLFLVTAGLFFIAGAGFYLSLKAKNLRNRFGQALLFLDPQRPGVGGPLGGRFTLNLNGYNPSLYIPGKLRAMLYCNKGWSSVSYGPGAMQSRITHWQNSVPVYLKQTSTGVDASFCFNIPDNCSPTNAVHDLSGVYWELVVAGEIEDVGEFKRTWKLRVNDKAAESTSVQVPIDFLDCYEKAERINARSILSQKSPLMIDQNQIELCTAWLSKGKAISSVVIGIIFSVTGILSLQSGWRPGTVLLIVGLIMTVVSVYTTNNKLRLKIDKKSRELSVCKELFGRTLVTHIREVTSPDQFSIVDSSANGYRGRENGAFSLSFVSQTETIKIATAMRGEKSATALRDAIVDELFPEDWEKLAA